MNKAIKDLCIEHSSIVEMLTIAGMVVAKLKNGDEVKKEHLEKMVEFITNFADKCHHGKEEGILFPELLPIPANVKSVNELLGEHKTGRDFIGGIKESLKK